MKWDLLIDQKTLLIKCPTTIPYGSRVEANATRNGDSLST